MAAFKFTMKRVGNAMALYIIYPDGSYNQVALYTVPNDNNWRADVTFFDGLMDIYKQRYKHFI